MTATMSGAEPWSHQGSEAGVLVLHGFTGSPGSMRDLAEAIAAAGYSVELPLLPGHGTAIDDMLATDWSDWSSAALSAYDDLAARTERVAVVGLSMGGSLATYVAQRRPVEGLVLINALVKPADPAIADAIDEALAQGVAVMEGIGSDIKRADTTEPGYDGTPLAGAKSLFAGVAEIHPRLGEITAPVLVLQSREDHVVSSDNGDEIVASVAGPVERIWLEDSYHVATMDNDRDLVIAATLDFLARLPA